METGLSRELLKSREIELLVILCYISFSVYDCKEIQYEKFNTKSTKTTIQNAKVLTENALPELRSAFFLFYDSRRSY